MERQTGALRWYRQYPARAISVFALSRSHHRSRLSSARVPMPLITGGVGSRSLCKEYWQAEERSLLPICHEESEEVAQMVVVRDDRFSGASCKLRIAGCQAGKFASKILTLTPAAFALV